MKPYAIRKVFVKPVYYPMVYTMCSLDCLESLILLNQRHARDVCIRISSYTKTLLHFTLNEVNNSVTGLWLFNNECKLQLQFQELQRQRWVVIPVHSSVTYDLTQWTPTNVSCHGGYPLIPDVTWRSAVETWCTVFIYVKPYLWLSSTRVWSFNP